MNNSAGEFERHRNRTLVVVEGDHEKFELFGKLTMCFPEMKIDFDDVEIFGTNIYVLNKLLAEEYGDKWYDEDYIDITLILNRKREEEDKLDKRDFTNIILIFDYERHEKRFKREIILHLKKHFNDILGDGILYINYPMVEAYLHIEKIPDPDYTDRMISVQCQPGEKYKDLVSKISYPQRHYYYFYDKIKRYLNNSKKVSEDRIGSITDRLMELSERNGLREKVRDIITEETGDQKFAKTFSYFFENYSEKMGYMSDGMSFREYLRKMYLYIADENIKKAWVIQNNGIQDPSKSVTEMFDETDGYKVLEIQNQMSKDKINGMIYVLSECFNILGDYKFFRSEERRTF